MEYETAASFWEQKDKTGKKMDRQALLAACSAADAIESLISTS